MLRTKADVDRHAANVLRKARNQKERLSRCFHLGQLFAKIGEYESVVRYISDYLSVSKDSAPAHKLLAQAYEGIGQFDNAIASYETSLKYDSTQSEIYLKVCSLYCKENVTFDPEKAKSWLDKTRNFFPYHQEVFKLKEKLLAPGSDNREEYEKLLLAEVKARPKDVILINKLLKLYIETKRLTLALKHSWEIEVRQDFCREISWYQCLDQVCEAYYGTEGQKIGCEFYIQWLTALDKLCTLGLSEVSNEPKNYDVDKFIQKFDRTLYKASHLRDSVNSIFNDFIDHMSAQLTFHLAILIIKKAKKESTWPEAKNPLGALLLLTTSRVHLKTAPVTNAKGPEQILQNIRYYQSSARTVQAGLTILALIQGSMEKKQFIDQIIYYTSGLWRNNLYEKLFNLSKEEKSIKYYFLECNYFKNIPQRLPSAIDLKPSLFVSSFEKTYSGSLHHLVWLGLQALINPAASLQCRISESFHTSMFKGLKFSNSNLTGSNINTLCQLDMDSFLYCTVLCCGSIAQKQLGYEFSDPEKPKVLPADVTHMLCSNEQLKWWKNACDLAEGNSKSEGEKLNEVRSVVQRGIEAVRGESLSLGLIVHLARTFAARVEQESDETKKDGCERRALYLWNQALLSLKGLLDRTVSMRTWKNSLFEYPINEVGETTAASLMEEGRYFVACHYVKSRLFDKALTMLEQVRSVESIFKQAEVYERMASESLESLRGNEITSELRARQAVLATKARDCLQQVVERLRSEPSSHALNALLPERLASVDHLLCRIEPENGVTEENAGNISNGSSMSFESPSSPVHNMAFKISSSSRQKIFPNSTPKQNSDYRLRSSALDIAELLTVHQNTTQMKIQQVLDRLESIVFEQRNQRSLIDDVLNKCAKIESEMKTCFADIKKDIKKPDLYNMLDDDDYNEDVLPYAMPPYLPHRGLQGSSTLTYGAPMQQYFSPNQIYPGNVGFYGGQPGMAGFGDTSQVAADYLRSLATGAAGLRPGPLAPGLTPGLTPGLAPGLVLPGNPQAPIPPNLAHFHLAAAAASTSSPPVKPPTVPAATLLNQTVLPPPSVPLIGVPLPLVHPGSAAPTNIVITTSDPLPTTPSAPTPSLSVCVPPEHRLGTPHVPHKFQIQMPSNFKLIEKSPVTQTFNEEEEEEKSKEELSITEPDPMPNYKPTIPLPDEVEVKTGEENETVLFDCKAKLFRFVDKEWKERGTGQLKILKNESSGQFRILMRREQVLKVCANHFIKGDMNLRKIAKSDKAWMWWANDFADEKVEFEKLSARFGSVDDAEKFKTVFEECQLAAKNKSNDSLSNDSLDTSASPISAASANANTKTRPILAPPKIIFAPSTTPQQSSTEKNDSKVVYGGITFTSPPKLTNTEENSKPGIEEKKKTQSPFINLDLTQPKSGQVKDSSNTSEGNSLLKNTSLESKTTVPESKISISAAQDTKSAPIVGVNYVTKKDEKNQNNLVGFGNLKVSGVWECSSCYISNKEAQTVCIACDQPKLPGLLESAKPNPAQTEKSSTGPKSTFSFGNYKVPSGWDCPGCYSRNKETDSICPACQEANPNAPPAAAKANPTPLTSSQYIFGKPSTETPAFKFGVPHAEPEAKITGAGFGGAGTPLAAQTYTPASQSEIFTFGSASTVPAKTTPAFSFGVPKFNFTMTSPPKGVPASEVSSPTTALAGNKSEDNSYYEDEEDHTAGIYFQPVVELPDKVDVKTGEEEEEVLYSHRAKLFRYDNHPDSKQWKERGVGDIKILKHKQNGKIRLLMRREPIMKLCLNHYLTKDIEMKQKDNKSWFWFAADFADGEVPKYEDAIQKFSVRFKTPEIAQEFKQAFLKVQQGLGSSERASSVSTSRNEKTSVSDGAKAAVQPSGGIASTSNGGDVNSSKDECDSDVEFVSESVISEELKQKALALQLPPYFYNYLNAPKCPGCPGCEDDSDTDDKDSTQAKGFVGDSKAGFATSLGFGSSFGNSLWGQKSTGQPLFSQGSVFGGSPQQPQLSFTLGSTPPVTSFFGSAVTPGTQSTIPSTSFSFCSVPPNPQSTAVSQPSLAPSGQAGPAIAPLSTFNYASPAAPKNGSTPQSASEYSNSSGAFTVSTQSTLPSSNFSFASAPPAPTQTPSLFQTGPAMEKPGDTPAMFPQDEVTFGSVASSGLSFAQKATNDFKWDGAGATIFGRPSVVKESLNTTQDTSQTEETEENEENEENDPYFAPVVPLPDKIELKTGEEDEDIIFSERGKLYRMDTTSKEWKERGIGNMKVLKHRIQDTYRLLMRREQVHKIVCNLLITSDLALNPMKSSETSWCLVSMNLAQDSPEPVKETLCIKFKNKELSDKFKSIIDDIKEQLRLKEAS